jgi:hypothetical protein
MYCLKTLKKAKGMKRIGSLLLLSTLTLGVFSTPVRAQSQSEDRIDLQTLSCRTLLEAEDDDRELTLVFMHGYMSGMKGEMMIDAPKLSAATDEVIDACIDNPEATLMSIFEQYR